MVQQYDLRNEIVSFWHEMEEPISIRSIQNTQGRREIKNAVLLILPTV